MGTRRPPHRPLLQSLGKGVRRLGAMPRIPGGAGTLLFLHRPPGCVCLGLHTCMQSWAWLLCPQEPQTPWCRDVTLARVCFPGNIRISDLGLAVELKDGQTKTKGYAGTPGEGLRVRGVARGPGQVAP